MLYFSILRKSDFLEKFSHNLTLEVQIVWKISVFQYYWWNYWNSEKQFAKKKIWKCFARLKQQPALRKLFSHPSNKSFLRFWNKNFPTEIYRNIHCTKNEEILNGKLHFLCSDTDIWFPSTSRMQVLAVWKWCSANVFFLTTNQNHVCWKICKVRKVFGCVAGVYFL